MRHRSWGTHWSHFHFFLLNFASQGGRWTCSKCFMTPYPYRVGHGFEEPTWQMSIFFKFCFFNHFVHFLFFSHHFLESFLFYIFYQTTSIAFWLICNFNMFVTSNIHQMRFKYWSKEYSNHIIEGMKYSTINCVLNTH